VARRSRPGTSRTRAPTRAPRAVTAASPPGLVTPGAWETVFRGPTGAAVMRILARWFLARRWFGGKARPLRRVALLDVVPIPCGAEGACLLIVEVRYRQGPPESYAVPLAFSTGARAEAMLARFPGAEVAPLQAGGRPGVLHAAEADPDFARALLGLIAGVGRLAGRRGELTGWHGQALEASEQGKEGREPHLLSAEQSNTSIRFGEELILKVFRRTEPGPNPDLEIGAYLTGVAGFRNTPPVLGGLEYRPRRGEPWSIGILQGFVPNQGDAWRFTLDAVGGFLERATAPGVGPAPDMEGPLLDLASAPPPPVLGALLGPYLDAAGLLGRRTAELHLALAGHPELPDFAPEPYTPATQRALRSSIRALVKDVFQLLRRRRTTLADEVGALADRVLASEGEIRERAGWVVERPLTALRTRTHGDYHLGQVLWTGRDFMIIDFEGEPARPLAARRAKASPLRDVAGMLRSYHYAAQQGLVDRREGGQLRPAQAAGADGWARAWQRAVSAAFLGAYLETARGATFLPASSDELRGLLDLFLTEKAIYELAYELNNRPAWVGLPLHGIADRLVVSAE